jgi:hypothetical protein
MWLLRRIMTRPAIGFGLAFASAGLLVIACSDRQTPLAPSGASLPDSGAATQVRPEGSHGDHSGPVGVLAATGLEDELAQVRKLTARFHRLEAAMEAGYELGYVNGSGVRIITGCVAHPTAGGMGYHYFNKELIDDLVVDPLKPEGLVYAPAPNGGLKLAAVEYVVPGLASNPPGVSEPPTVFGMEMVILVPAVGFYTLHAWVWGHNPTGMFAHWNPEVVCP